MLTPLVSPDETPLEYFRRLIPPDPKRAGFRLGDFCTVILGLDHAPSMVAFATGYIAHLIAGGTDPAEARQIALANIGWVYGEGMSEARIQMWYRATGAAHPVFGIRTPTPLEALEAGMALGAAALKAEGQ